MNLGVLKEVADLRKTWTNEVHDCPEGRMI